MINLTIEQSNLIYLNKCETRKKTIQNLIERLLNIDEEDYFVNDLKELIKSCILLLEKMTDETFYSLNLTYEE